MTGRSEKTYTGTLWIGERQTSEHRPIAQAGPVFSFAKAEQMRTDFEEALGDGDGTITHWEINVHDAYGSHQYASSND